MKTVYNLCECEGVLVSGSGEHAVRLRPALIFQEHHADIFLNIFDQVLHDNNWALGVFWGVSLIGKPRNVIAWAFDSCLQGKVVELYGENCLLLTWAALMHSSSSKFGVVKPRFLKPNLVGFIGFGIFWD